MCSTTSAGIVARVGTAEILRLHDRTEEVEDLIDVEEFRRRQMTLCPVLDLKEETGSTRERICLKVVSSLFGFSSTGMRVRTLSLGFAGVFPPI
jgi:hypothetical protein